jgi:hypothetical protein
MSESTRRNFLIASGAAAVGVAAALPGTASAAAAGKQVAGKPSKDAEPLVAHVGDPSTGMVSLFVADRELVLHDPDLVARLTRAAAQSKEA